MLPGQPEPQLGLQVTSANAPGVISIGGITQIKSLPQLLAEEKAAAVLENTRPIIQNLAMHVRKCFSDAESAKRTSVEPRLLAAMRQRRGEYEPDLLAQLREQNSALIYMMLTSNKCRAASAWVRDAFVTATEDKPWSIEPTPVADLDPQTTQLVIQEGENQIAMALMQGLNPSDGEVRGLLLALKEQALVNLQEEAKRRSERMSLKMEDQLVEGGFSRALSEFIDDLVTFPAAILKGPVVRKRPKLSWTPTQDGSFEMKVEDKLTLEWERVDPFNIYPAADATGIADGYLIERHRLHRSDLVALKGVEGYSDKAIDAVLDEFGKGGLHDWLSVDTSKASVEGKATIGAATNPSQLIDALQYWGSVQGKLLLEWGMTEQEVPEPLKEYDVECWVIGNWVIKATINSDPMGRKPYYKGCWEEIPGCFWGNSIPDLCRDTQNVCNAAARALVNNMGLASGPQVVYNVSRLPEGENLTQLFPWKIWQTKDDPLAGGSGPPVDFFQPSSNAQELMAIYERFSTLADEYTGIPRYMTGDSSVGGAARTASGMSMLMSNAGKSIKNVVSGVDLNVIEPAVSRLYYYNMRYSDDPELKGDVCIVARGASSLIQKEAAAQRRNEFLQIALTNPVANQIIGNEGVAAMLRETAKTLGMNTDEIIPALPILKMRWMQQQMLAMQQQQMMAQAQGGNPEKPDQRQLMNGAPVENQFSPQKQ